MSRQALATATPATKPPVAPQSPIRKAELREGSGQPAASGLTVADTEIAQPPPLDPIRRGARDFAGLTSRHSQSGDVQDQDLVRAQVTRLLIEQLAPALGLDPSRITIRVDRAAEARTNAAGASGLQEGSTIHLHPTRFRPQTAQGRYLLAHETVHVAQRQLSGPPDWPSAELEAAELGLRFARGESLHRPQHALRAAVAADAGVKQDAPPATPTIEESQKTLQTQVVTGRSREIAEIKKALSGLWVSDGDVFDIMRILDSLSFWVANAVVRSLEEKERYWLADNINPPHVYKHRRSVLLSYFGTLEDGRLQDAVDLKVFRALPIAGMTTEETLAASYTLEHLRDDQRQALLTSDNGPAIKRIICAPKPSEDELKRIREDAAASAADETRQAEQRKAILAQKDDASAQSLLDQVRQLLTRQSVSSDDHQPDASRAQQALDLLQQSRHGDNDPRFLYVAEQMDQEGLIDTLLQALPIDAYMAPPDQDHPDTLVALVRSRLPYKTDKLIEDLLSYGVFDWAIRDYEALFAYKLIKLLPLADQYKFRMRDSGKWYLRLLENLPDDRRYPGIEVRRAESRKELDELKGKYKTLAPADEKGLGTQEVQDNGETKLYYNASQLYETKLARDKNAAQTLESLKTDFKEQSKDWPALYQELVTLGEVAITPGSTKPDDLELREAVIRELDSLGYIDKLFGKLDDSFLFSEANRISTVKIMLARDTAHVQAHARELVSRGFTDWMVTDKEAYLAYLCVKSLPQDEREAFIANNPDEWSRIQGEMSASMRQSRDLNLYIGDKAGTDRASVLGQLAEAGTWSDDNAALLNDLLRMAIAMTEHHFAFDRSKEFKAVTQAKLAPLVEKYRLWDPQKRPDYKPDILKGTRWYEEGVFADLKSLWSGAVMLWNLDLLFVNNKVGAKVDLNDVQDFMGGDLMGAQLGDPKKRGAAGKPSSPDANKLTVLIGLDGKSAELVLPELMIDSANVQLAGTTFQSGQINLKGLHVHAAYDQEDLGQPTQAAVELQSVEANDLLLAKSSSMLTITRLALTALRLAAGTIDTVTGGAGKARDAHSVPFPLLVVPLLALFMLLALPVYLYKKIAGLANEGLDSGGSFAGDVATRTKAIDFSFDNLEVDSLTTSGGQHVGHVGIRDVAVRVGLNKATRLRAEKASIEQRLKRLQGKPEAAKSVEDLKQRKAAIEADQVQVDQDEKEYLEIQRRILKGKLSAEEQAQLQKRLDALNFEDKGAAFIDIGEIEASGLSGGLTTKDPIRLSNIHGQGDSGALTQMVALPTATPAELSRRSANEERPAAPLDKGRDGALTIELGDVSSGEIALGGGLRSYDEIDKQVKALEATREYPEVKPLYESLLTLRDKAARYELLVRRGLSSLSPPQLDEFRSLRASLTAQASLLIKSIALTRAKLTLNLATSRASLHADIARITGVQMPERGLEIKEVYAEDLEVGATVGGSILGFLDWRKNLQTGDLGAALLKLSDVSDAKSGVGAKEVAITGLHADVDRNQGDARANLRGTITVTGASTQFSQYALEQALTRLKQRDPKSLPPDKRKVYETKVREISAFLKTLYQLQELVRKDSAALAAATNDAQRAEAQRLLDMDRGNLDAWNQQLSLRKLTVSDLNLEISGLGDILSPDYSVDRVLNKGVHIAGGGPGGQMFKGIKAEGVLSRQGPHTESNINEVDIGPFSGSVDYSTSKIKVKGELASVAVSGLNYRSPDADLWSDGKSELKHLRLSVSVTRPPVGKDGQPSQQPTKVEVDEFHIDSIKADGLGYKDKSSNLQVDIPSGQLRDIWLNHVAIELPADEFADVTIHEDQSKATPDKPSGFGVGHTDNVSLIARTGEGLTASGTLNAGLLTAHFVEGGGKEINLQYLKFTGGKLTQKDLDVDFNTTVTGIHVSLLKDGRKKFSADDVELHASGTAGKTGFATDIEHASTGEITMDDKMISAPNVVFPSIKLSRLHLEGTSYTLDIPAGQVTELGGTTLNLEIERNPSPKKGESSMKKIFIRELKVPFTLLRGCTITLIDQDGDDTTITLPNGVSGGIENLWIKPTADQADAFTIIPDQNWAMVGGFSFDRANLIGVGAKIPGVFDATANVKASGFYMGFLTDGTNTIDLNRVDATEIQGKIKGSKFSMMTGKSRFGGNAGLTLGGIHKNKDGLTIDQLGVAGFVYENNALGLTLDIQSATLPGPTGGLQMPDKGPIKIPRLNINNAYFRIDDLMAMDTGGSGAPGKPSKVDADLLNFLDRLEGDIDLVIHVDADYLNKLTTDFPLKIHISKGQIDYAQMEDQLFSNSTLLQQAIDFEYDNGRLYIQLDLKTLGAAAGATGGAIIPFVGPIVGGAGGFIAGAAKTRELYGWDLKKFDTTARGSINEQKLAEREHKVRLKSLIRPFMPDGTASPPGSGSGSSSSVGIHDINVNVNGINLGLKGQSVVDLSHLNKSGLKGRIKLGAPGVDAVTGLTAKGDMKTGFALGLGEANLSVDGLAIEGDNTPSKKRPDVYSKTDTKVSTGNIHIGSLSGASLTFDKGRTGSLKHLQIFPTKLEGTVTTASAEDIEVTLDTSKRVLPGATP